MRTASQDNPLVKSKVAGILQRGVERKHTLSVREHADILQAQVSFQISTIETIRKQLVYLGALIDPTCYIYNSCLE